MAGPERGPDPHLKRLLESGNTYGFFQAVQMIQRHSPGAKAVGTGANPGKEALRFKVSPSLSFPAGDVERIRKPDEAERFEMTVTFMGLVGAGSPLSAYMTEEALRDYLDADGAVTAFYDIFHHRLISLFYRAWEKYHVDAAFRSDGSDEFTQRVSAFVGVDPDGPPSKEPLPPRVLLGMASLLSQKTRSARTLELVLERVLPGVDVRVESFIARSVHIPTDQRVKLGIANTSLNLDFTIGRRVFDRSGRFRVKLGPVGYDDLEELLPGGASYPFIRRLIDRFSRGILESELEVEVKKGESPQFQLGNRRGAMLGMTTQLVAERKRPMRLRVLLSESVEDAKPEVVPDDED